MRLVSWLARAVALALFLLVTGAALADGSWVAEAPGVRVSLADRETASATLTPPGAVPPGARIQSVAWRYRLPPGAAVRARVCHPAGCRRLATPRGTTRALAGLDASVPLQFRFRLPPGETPLRVEGLQLIVNHH